MAGSQVAQLQVNNADIIVTGTDSSSNPTQRGLDDAIHLAERSPSPSGAWTSFTNVGLQMSPSLTWKPTSRTIEVGINTSYHFRLALLTLIPQAAPA